MQTSKVSASFKHGITTESSMDSGSLAGMTIGGKLWLARKGNATIPLSRLRCAGFPRAKYRNDSRIRLGGTALHKELVRKLCFDPGVCERVFSREDNVSKSREQRDPVWSQAP